MEDRWHGAPGGPFRDAGSSSTDGYALGAGRSLSAAASSVNGSHSAADGHIECAFGCSPVEMCYALGIVIHVVGSIGINIGQNLQALAMANSQRDGEKFSPCKSKIWISGMATFIVSSIVTFGALALAPAGILVPLESVQFVVNIAFNRIVRGKAITLKMVLGVVLVMAGIGLFVAFGPNEDGCFDEASLRSKWTGTGWHIYLAIFFSLAAIFYVTWRWYASSRSSKERSSRTGRWSRSCTHCSALFGGGQMIVHTRSWRSSLSSARSPTRRREQGLPGAPSTLVHPCRPPQPHLTARLSPTPLTHPFTTPPPRQPTGSSGRAPLHLHLWPLPALPPLPMPRRVRPPLYHPVDADGVHHLWRSLPPASFEVRADTDTTLALHASPTQTPPPPSTTDACMHALSSRLSLLLLLLFTREQSSTR